MPTRMTLPVAICAPARRTAARGAEPAYRPAVRLRQPHWQLFCSQRQVFTWHPQEQDTQSQVPQQVVFSIVCVVDLFTSAMVGLL